MSFFTRYKNILIVIAFVFIIFVLGFALYSMFFKTSPLTPSEQENNSATTTGSLPNADNGPSGQIVPENTTDSDQINNEIDRTKIDQVASGGITQATEITTAPSLGTTMGGNGSDLQYYNKEDGKFYRIDEKGEATTISSKVFHEVQNVVWSPNKNKAILEYPDGAKIIYDFDSDKQVTLPSHWKDFSYSPDGNQLVLKSIGQDENNRWLAIVNEDGTNVRGLEPLGDKDDSVYAAWSPNNQIVSMFTEGKNLDSQEVFFVGMNNENFKSTIIEGRGFQPQWAPDGGKLLYSVYSTETALKPSLWIVDAGGDNIGEERKNLNVPTWADKCTFASATDLYCAVPEKLAEGSGLFPEIAKNTIDSLYKIDIVTGNKKLMAVPNGDYTISNILISEDKKNLYFTNQSDSKLYKVRLK